MSELLLRRFIFWLLALSLFHGCRDEGFDGDVFENEQRNYILLLFENSFYFGPALTPVSAYGDENLRTEYAVASESCRDLGEFALTFGDDPPIRCGNFEIEYRRLVNGFEAQAFCVNERCSPNDQRIPRVKYSILDGEVNSITLNAETYHELVLSRRNRDRVDD